LRFVTVEQDDSLGGSLYHFRLEALMLVYA
jgi:hypothetical protein